MWYRARMSFNLKTLVDGHPSIYVPNEINPGGVVNLVYHDMDGWNRAKLKYDDNIGT